MMKWVHTRGFGSFLGPRCPLPERCVSIFVMRLASLSSQGEMICVAGSYFTTCRKGWAWQQSSDVAGKGNEGEGKRRRKSWEEAFTSWVPSWQVNSGPSQL